jgi:hypothetical protein
MLPEAAVLELEATVRPTRLSARVGRGMAEDETAIASLSRLWRHYHGCQHCCKNHYPVHHLSL